MLEITKVNVHSGMCCAVCKAIMQAGDKVRTHSKPIFFKWGKQRKKAKANIHVTLMVHSRCHPENQP